jgi:hypothetical protein
MMKKSFNFEFIYCKNLELNENNFEHYRISLIRFI